MMLFKTKNKRANNFIHLILVKQNGKYHFFPNGTDKDNIGHFTAYLRLLKHPSSCNKIIICRRIICPHQFTSQTDIVTYESTAEFRFKDGIICSEKIKQMYKQNHSCTVMIIIGIQILQITSKDNSIIWENKKCIGLTGNIIRVTFDPNERR
eukprot:86519_1